MPVSSVNRASTLPKVVWSEPEVHGFRTETEPVEEAEQEQQLMKQWEHWLFPPTPAHLDSPRASLRVICQTQPDSDQPARHRLGVQFHIFRSRTMILTGILVIGLASAYFTFVLEPGSH